MDSTSPDVTGPGEGRRIDYVPLDDIAGTDGNPKAHDIGSVIRSICALGYTAPAVLDERTEQLVIGNGRLEALRIIRAYVNGDDVPDKYEPVFSEKPVKDGLTGGNGLARHPDGVRLDSEGTWLVPLVRGWASADDEQARAAVIADNQLTVIGGWDDRALAEWLDDIAADNPDMLEVAGFTREALDDMLAAIAPPPDLDALADEYGDPDDSDLWPILRIKVPPHVRNTFYSLTENAGGTEDSTRFIHLVEVAADQLGADA
ncbi:hypothetical protein [Actinomadura violacea]|uniref:ParB/Sulfiredoxin domain-containing protein n=1 Tax=Actinomadura violacea TaxID=2819934 RepID=A0ABS3RY14_9ACTN|nr:hypothetical protein [Actinomadura violacea]MBO2461597.1 hypothetical protein [Actinomadura violacea]